MSRHVTKAVLGFAAIAAATALVPTSASAVPFGTAADRASFTISGQFSFSETQDTNSDSVPNLGENFTLIDTPELVGGSQTNEFNAIVDPDSTGAPLLAPGTPDVSISDGPANVGFTLTFGYDRSLGSLGGSEEGTLDFTITDVLTESVSETGGTNIVSLQGLGNIVDTPTSGGDFYDDDQPFSVSFTGSIGDVDTVPGSVITGSYSATFSSPPDPSIVPVPASLGLLGAGLIGLGLATRRRARV